MAIHSSTQDYGIFQTWFFDFCVKDNIRQHVTLYGYVKLSGTVIVDLEMW